MILENTLHNKHKFFAQYWGSKVAYVEDEYQENNVPIYPYTTGSNCMINEIVYLKLTPLSQITDEDALALAGLNNKMGYNGFDIFNNKESAIRYIRNNIHLSISQDRYSADFIRLRGYALDWNGVTVEEQIKRGWIKLKKYKL